MKKYTRNIFMVIAISGGAFFFFYVPKQDCVTLRDPSGAPRLVCAPTKQSLYQRIYLAQHQYFFSHDSCLVNIETGDVDCKPFLTTGYNQSATTTDLTAFVSLHPVTQEKPLIHSDVPPLETVWKTYTSKELGISLMYPSGKSANDLYWGAGRGETGGAFHADIGLPSGSVIYAYATTKDYSSGKDGFPVSTEGFVAKDEKYYAVSRGNPVSTAFSPDEIWKMSDGSSALVIYGKNYDPSLDYPDPAVRVMINIPHTTFTGIGFVLWNMNTTGSHPVAPEDVATLKKIVTSIEFTK